MLAAKGIYFEAVTMPLPSDTSVAVGKATVKVSILKNTTIYYNLICRHCA